MKIVTGYRGASHITSEDMQALYRCIVGTECYIFPSNTLEYFQPTVDQSNLTITIGAGNGIFQGVFFRTPHGETDTIEIDPVATGYTRRDYICIRYERSASGVETMRWNYVKGTPVPSSGTPAAPSYVEGDISVGDLVAEYPLIDIYVSDSVSTPIDVIPPTINIAPLAQYFG